MERLHISDQKLEAFIQLYKDNIDYFCTNTSYARYVRSKQVIWKCRKRNCEYLVKFQELNDAEKRMWLTFWFYKQHAQQNGFWICQEKTSPSPQNERRTPFNRQDKVQLDFSTSSGQSSKVTCSICLNQVEVPTNQLLVFCPTCDVQFTNQLALEED